MAQDAAHDWVLVTKKIKKKKHRAKQQQSTDIHRAHATSAGVNRNNNRKTDSGASSYDVIDRDARVASDKQRAILARVMRVSESLQQPQCHRITTACGDASSVQSLVGNALRAIAAHMEWPREPSHQKEEPQRRLHIVSYGLGSFCTSSNAVHQLAFVHALVQCAIAQYGSIDTTLEIYDPVMNASDREIAAALGIHTIDTNESGKRIASVPTVFFMPHCGHALYQNILLTNYQADTLHHAVIIGNSFEAYSDRLIDSVARKASVPLSMLPFLTESALPLGIAASHDDFPVYEAAFNDLSIHTFSTLQSTSAQADSKLQALIQATTLAAATTSTTGSTSSSVLASAIDRELIV